MKNILITILVIISLGACEEPVKWTLDDSITPRLVVEAMLTNQPGSNYVKLSLPVKDPNNEPRSLSNATVVIIEGDNYHFLTESTGEPGVYFPEGSMRGVVNKIYWLYIAIGDHEFAGAAYMLPVSPLKPFIHYEDPEVPGNYRIYPLDSNTPAYVEYRIQWQNSTDGSTEESVFFTYTLSTLDVSEFFKPDTEVLSFPANARIIRTKYSLTPDHERYLRSLLSETEWRGGWFDVMHGNLHTNLNNGAVGFFAACSVVRDTVYFD